MQSIILPLWFGLALTLVVCGGALWKGGADERIVAGGFLAAWVITLIFRDRSWIGTQWSTFIVDGAYLALMLYVALRSDRYWPLAATACQLLSVITHAARMVDSALGEWAYVTANVIWTQLSLVALGIGVLGAWRQRRKRQA